MRADPAGQRVEHVEAQPTAAFSIDVEDWFHVENLKPAIARESWSSRELRVERNMDRLLQLLEDAPGSARATCFVLGWVAARCPSLVEKIVSAGHEIASHGFGHELVPTLSPDAFLADVTRSKALLEDLVGVEIRGYRAPSFSITDWAVPVLQEAGFSYDSSFFASVAHDRYGRLSDLRAEDSIVELAPGFHEVPISSLLIGSRPIPWGGGGYFRAIPYAAYRWGIRRIIASERPYVFYIHPWEVDPDQPRLSGIPLTYRIRHYLGLKRSEARLSSLLADFRWTTVSRLIEQHSDALTAPRVIPTSHQATDGP
jgi:polysaccharide deacetylase family protein (PEP-CTERM system associated)